MSNLRDKVCIMLSSYNGEKYIDEQIRSILDQSGVDVTLLIRDDGSSDSTDLLIKKWASDDSRVKILLDKYGENMGVTQSFMYLLKKAVELFPETDYFFFSDQDDYWLKKKCSRAVSMIKKSGQEKALYFSSKVPVDSELNKLKKSDHVECHNDVWDVFDRSNAFGCTMCITREYASELSDIDFNSEYMHDALVYRIALITGVYVVCDKCGTIYYRQHSSNVTGLAKRNYLNGIKKIFFRKSTHYVSKMTEYIVKELGIRPASENDGVIDSLLIYRKSLKAKLRLFKGFLMMRGRSLKSKVVSIGSLVLNYY